MIRINLLAVERKAVKRAVMFQSGQKITAGCTAILTVAVLLVGWRYWTLQQQSVALDKDISVAQQETTRLHGVIQQVQQFEQQRAPAARGADRAAAKDPDRPVHTRSISQLPPMLWLTELKQADDSVVTTVMHGGDISRFRVQLEASGHLGDRSTSSAVRPRRCRRRRES
jgi:hypothetical protein